MTDMPIDRMANLLVQTVDATGVDDALNFCNLPPRKSVTSWEEQPRMSYYNGTEQQGVPFKWEASPGKPMVADSQQPGSSSLESSAPQLRPPPGAGAAGRRSRKSSFDVGVEVPDRQGSTASSYSSKSTAAGGGLPASEQRSRLPPRNRKLGRVPQPTINTGSTAPSTVLTAAKPGHRRGYQSNDFTSSSARSDFDWPEVSDDEQSSTSPRDREQEPVVSMPAAAVAVHIKEESFSSSRSSFSSTSTTSSPASSGALRGSGDSPRDLVLLRNLVHIAAASAATPSTVRAVPFNQPVYEDVSEEDEDESDNARPPGRGLFSCMPIFSRVRMIQSQLGKSEKQMAMPAVINFSNRLTPGLKNMAYRS